MKNPFRSEPKTSRSYPAAGTSVSGPSGRFSRAKTSGARKAGRDGDAWENRDRQQEKSGGVWYRAAR
ncbi:hypothetical protein OG458_42050 (plasmid) [Streptomyces sp. NBC_01281]|uniref:hypothetical protein n=1 Tax=Streptomyces sp. NBC_01281 TaxID=2903811 RepID=UPI002E15517C|nr:hypothetical protein OG458_42050 [Streptomyces sp. NBC_01281]